MMRDVLRLSHPVPDSDSHRAAFAWATGKLETLGHELVPPPQVLADHIAMNKSSDAPIQRALWGVKHNLPREALPTEALNTPEVQRALLPSMPIHALLRNLGNLTASGVLTNGADEVQVAAATLRSKNTIMRGRVHPFVILLASLVYKQGHGVRGSKTSTPVPAVLGALEDAYDLAFDSVTPTGKRILVAIDVSRSMTETCMGTPVPANLAASAMALTMARAEPNAVVVKFDTEVRQQVAITKRTSILSLEAHAGNGTDLGAPLRWALGEAPNTPGACLCFGLVTM